MHDELIYAVIQTLIDQKVDNITVHASSGMAHHLLSQKGGQNSRVCMNGVVVHSREYLKDGWLIFRGDQLAPFAFNLNTGVQLNVLAGGGENAPSEDSAA